MYIAYAVGGKLEINKYNKLHELVSYALYVLCSESEVITRQRNESGNVKLCESWTLSVFGPLLSQFGIC